MRKRSAKIPTSTLNPDKGAIDLLPQPVVLLDDKSRVVMANRSFCRMFGLKLKESVGRALSRTGQGWNKPALQKLLKQALLAKNPGKDIEADFKLKNGKGRTLRISMQRIAQDADRKPLIMIVLKENKTGTQENDTLQMFRFSIEQAGEAVFWMDRAGRFTYVNDQACRSLGYSREKLLRLCLWDIDPVFPRERWDSTWRNYKKNGQCESEVVESLHRRKDGVCFPVEVAAKHIWFGKTEFHVAYVRDITDRKRAEGALHKSDERLRQAIRVSHIGIFDHNHLHDTIYWSPRQREIYGWSMDEPVTMAGVIGSIYPEDREKIATAIRQAHDPAGKGRYDVEHRIIRRDGAVRWLTIRSRTFFEGEGHARHPVRTVGAAQDITEQKQLEEELRLTQSAIDVASIACFWVSREAKLCYVNQQACRSMGYTREELLSMTVMDIDPDFSLEMWEKFWQTHSRDKVQTFETTHLRKDGSRFPVEITTNYLSYGGRDYSCAYVRDITQRKQAEREKGDLEMQLTQAQKMESVGRLAGGVAHDFNNMLGVILGYLELLKGSLSHDSPLYTHLQEIEKAATHSKEITRQLLAFSRKQIIAPRIVNLNDLIWDTQKTLARLIGEHIDLRFMPQHDLWTIKVDPTQIDQILVNLCVNARDAMSDGGILAVETGNEVIDENFCRQHAGMKPG